MLTTLRILFYKPNSPDCLEVPLCCIKDISKTGGFGIMQKKGVQIITPSTMPEEHPPHVLNYFKINTSSTDSQIPINPKPPRLTGAKLKIKFHEKTRDAFYEQLKHCLDNMTFM